MDKSNKVNLFKLNTNFTNVIKSKFCILSIGVNPDKMESLGLEGGLI